MKLWFTVRRGPAILAALAAMTVAALALPRLAFAMPGVLVSHGVSVPIAVITPLVLSSVLGWALASGDPVLESVAVRRIAMLDVALGTGTAVAAVAASLAVSLLTAAPEVLTAGRNGIAYVGLVLLGGRLAGPRAGPLLPAAIVVLTAVIGGDASGQPRWWAWPLAPTDSALAWSASIACLVVGAVVTLVPRRMTSP